MLLICCRLTQDTSSGATVLHHRKRRRIIVLPVLNCLARWQMATAAAQSGTYAILCITAFNT